MKKAPRNRVAGVGTAVGAVMIFGSMLGLGCQPGSLPCDKADWKEICAMTPGADGGAGTGGVSGTGGGGAGTGGMSGGTGGMAGGPVTPATVVAGCDAYKTVGEMDKFFAMRCGDTAACHTTGYLFGDLKTTDVFKRVVMKDGITCAGTKLADTTDYTKGLIWIKVQDMPKCSDGKAAATRMPSMPAMPLSDTEKTCLENYLKALAGK